MTTALDLLDALVVDADGTRWGSRATELQRRDAEALLDLDGPRRHWIGRSRGYSKSDDLAAVSVAVMLTQLRPGDEAIAVAADKDQARILIDRVRWIERRTPELKGLLEVGAYDVRTANGVRFEAIAADAPSSWGRSPAWAVVDELCRHPDADGARELWDSVSSAVVKVAGRLAIISTASTPDHWSKGVYDHALSERAWRVSETHNQAPWISRDEIEAERRRLPPAVFAQLWKNRWTAAAGSFFDPGVLDAAFVLDGPALEREGVHGYVAGLDIGTVHDRTVLSIGHKVGDAVLLDGMVAWAGSHRHPVDFEAIETAIVEAYERFHFKLRLDPWQGLDLAQRLRKRGLRVEEFTFSTASKQKLAATLLSAVNNGKLKLYEADGLREELLALRLVQTAAGTWSFDHKARKGHDDRAVSLALMATALLERGDEGAAWLEVWEKERADNAADPAASMRAEHPGLASMPHVNAYDPDAVERRTAAAGSRCSGQNAASRGGSLGGRHIWEHKPDGDQCKACGLWLEGSLR
jgi:hypothetical protein